MEITNFTTQDFKDLTSWCEKRECQQVPEDSLSDTGFIVKHEDKKILMGWFYKTNSNLSWIEFVITNPEIKSELRSRAMDLFFNFVADYAKECGFKHVLVMTGDEQIINRMKKLNYHSNDEKLIMLGRGV